MAHRFVFLFVLISLVSCATSTIITGQDFNTTNIDKIQKGKTTKQEILGMFGQPYIKTVNSFGETWTYQYLKAVGKATSFLITTNSSGQSYQKNLAVTFDSVGVTQTYNYTVSGEPALYQQK